MNEKEIRQFRNILRKFDRELLIQDNEACCSGVTLAQCHTLLEIESKEETTVGELASSLSLDKSTISRTVDGLVNLGLIDRIIPESNRRIATINLTSQGKKVCDTINFTNDDYVKRVFLDFSSEETKIFVQLFERLCTNMVKVRDENKDDNCCNP